MSAIQIPANPRVLIVALRRLGDVLLTTPLIRSVKRAFPGAAIEALVFSGTEGILSGNPDLSGVMAISPRPGASETLSLLRRLARRYDLALSTQTGDRPTTLAWIAGRQSAGPVEAEGFGASVKRLALTRSYVRDREQHRVGDVLRLAELLGIPAISEIVCPQGEVRRDLVPAQPYAVVHAAPMFKYKRWTVDGWRELAAALRQRGLGIVTSGAKSDAGYLDEIWRGSDVVRLDGKLDWPELTAAIRSARGLCRARYRHYASCRGHRHADGCAVRADRPAALGAVAARRTRSAMGGGRHDPAARQCLAGTKSAALLALPARGLRAAARQL